VGLPPTLTLEQRRAALHKAANARKERALFKEDIKQGKRSWRDAFSDPRESIQKMRVKELLESVPGFGQVRAVAVLERANISFSRRIQGLGKNQRESLFRLLGAK
jgi:hypothetical protein